MDRRNDDNPRKEEESREHARSDRGGPGQERPMKEQVPGQEGRPEFERTRDPGRHPGETQRQGRESEQQPSKREEPRKFGEHRDQPAGRRDQGSR